MNDNDVKVEQVNKFLDTLETIANDAGLKVTNNKVNQVQRNQLKQDLTEGLATLIQSTLEVANLNKVALFRVKEGIALVVDNEDVGMISCVVNVMMKDMDYDAVLEEQMYREECCMKQMKKQQLEKQKQQRIEEARRARETKQQEIERKRKVTSLLKK